MAATPSTTAVDVEGNTALDAEQEARAVALERAAAAMRTRTSPFASDPPFADDVEALAEWIITGRRQLADRMAPSRTERDREG